MRQVLFYIPLNWISDSWPSIPIHGYGFMLFLAFVFCTWLAARLARRQGIPTESVQDLAIWLFVCGIAGARATYMIQYGVPIWKFYEVWECGLVFYGSAIGGLVGFLGAYYFVLRPRQISAWKMADVVAPCVALGLCLGRVGCLLNGCCYGGVACPECPAVSFPLPTEPRKVLVEQGYQTAAGFTLTASPKEDPRTISHVEPGSPAAQAGLQAGDVLIRVNGRKVNSEEELWIIFVREWPRGKNDIALTVLRDGEEVNIGPYSPWTIGLHPTQIYESISTGLLFFLLMAYFPFRRHDGEVIVLLMIGYSIHRFINEILRNDTDPVAFGMTLSQNGSILVLLAGIALGIYLWRQPPQHTPGEPTPTVSPTPVEKPWESEPTTALQD